MTSYLAKDLQKIYKEENTKDITFKLSNNSTIRAHKFFIGLLVPDFRKLGFSNEFKLPNDISFKGFTNLIKYCYAESLDNSTEAFVDTCYCAMKYKVEGLIDYCNNYITSYIRKETLIKFLQNSIKFNQFERFEQNIIKWMYDKNSSSRNNTPEMYFKNKEFYSYHPKIVRILVLGNKYYVKHELLLDACLNWYQYNNITVFNEDEDVKENLSDKYIKFPYFKKYLLSLPLYKYDLNNLKEKILKYINNIESQKQNIFIKDIEKKYKEYNGCSIKPGRNENWYKVALVDDGFRLEYTSFTPILRCRDPIKKNSVCQWEIYFEKHGHNDPIFGVSRINDSDSWKYGIEIDNNRYNNKGTCTPNEKYPDKKQGVHANDSLFIKVDMNKKKMYFTKNNNEFLCEIEINTDEPLYPSCSNNSDGAIFIVRNFKYIS